MFSHKNTDRGHSWCPVEALFTHHTILMAWHILSWLCTHWLLQHGSGVTHGRIKITPVIFLALVRIAKKNDLICDSRIMTCCGVTWTVGSGQGLISLFNSLVPGRCGSDFKSIIFKLSIKNSSLISSCQIPLRWMPQNLTFEQSTLVQVMAWCMMY